MVSNKKKTISNIFIAVSIIFLATMVLFYGGRFIYYYKNSHIKEEVGHTLLVDVINSLSYNGSMVKEGNNVYYSGNIMNNYLYYSNRYYRIIGVEDGNIVLVDDTISTMLPYDKDYEESDINKWLNKTEEYTGIYYNSLSNPDKYLTETKTCLDSYDSENITCDKFVKSDVGMISLNQYLRANVNGNYLNQSKYYWFSNKDSEGHNWYIDQKNEVTITNTNPIYGVRPVITLKSDVIYYGGSGTMYEPYLITLEDAEKLDDINIGGIGIGSYITYSDSVWQVIGETDDYYKLLSTESIGNMEFSNTTNKVNLKDKKSLIYYLNNDYYETLDQTTKKKGIVNIGSFNDSYLDKYTETEELYVGLAEMGDLYIGIANNSNTITNTGTKNTIYKITNGRLYSDLYTSENGVNPVIFVDKSLKPKSGYGTFENPYTFNDESDEVGEE